MIGSRFFTSFTKSNIPKISGMGLGLYGFHLSQRHLLIASDRPIPVEYNVPPPNTNVRVIQRGKSRFGGKLDYQQLSTGSFLGLLLGYVTGKLSKLICFLTFTSLLSIQFLESRGIIQYSDIPFVTRIYNYLAARFNVTSFISNKPSFKLSFLSSFLIAAFNT